jgi:Tfp pilus assembly protein PilF
MEYDPAARYGDAQELARDLRRLLARRSRNSLFFSLALAGITVVLALYNVYLFNRQGLSYDRNLERGLDSLNRKEYRNATTHLEAALLLKKRGLVFVLKAEAHLALQEYTEAEACCDSALSIAPNFSRAHLVKGIVYERAGQPEKAIASFRRAVETAERSWMPLHELDTLQEEMGPRSREGRAVPGP